MNVGLNGKIYSVRESEYMLQINYKQIYETKEYGKKEWVLILYNISANHYVGIPVYANESSGLISVPSIKKYVDVNKIKDYNKSKMERCIYASGKPLKISDEDYYNILSLTQKGINQFLSNINVSLESISFLKWCKDKYNLNNELMELPNLKQGAIYWVNMGYNIGSELRKLRPAILWRATKDKKTWTMIPLTTKKRADQYYFHYDLECLKEGTAKIENIMNYSYKRIIAPYFSKDKLAIITKKDYEQIKKIIGQYYLFEK